MPYARGRRRGARWISGIPMVRVFGPMDMPPKGVIQIKYEELEALRLTDVEGMDQEQAAATMGISRKSFWLDLKRARMKVAKALVEGFTLQVEGGSYMVRGESREEMRPGGPPGRMSPRGRRPMRMDEE
jgi:predicted DNA-binding protein (UPF0251 family)